MVALKEKEGVYFSSFMELEERLAASGPSWLHEIRRAAMEGFAEKGFPSTRQEEWRNTNVAPIAAVPFRPATTSWERGHPFAPLRAGSARTTAGRMPALPIGQLPLADLGCPRLVFINGRFSKQLSALEALPKGVKAGSLAEALASDGKILECHLTRFATDYKEHAFVALNTAFLEDGAFLEIPKSVVLEKPIYLLYVSDPSGLPTVSYPRNLIIAGRESQASIVEGYISLGGTPLAGSARRRSETAATAAGADQRRSETAATAGGAERRRSETAATAGGAERRRSEAAATAAGAERRRSETAATAAPEGVYFTNAVSEIVVGEGAVLEYHRIQQESERAFHFGRLQFHQEHSSNLATHSIALGGALVREEVKAVLGGEGAEATLNGLYLVAGRQHIDNQTTLDHAQPHCSSREVYKGVLDGESSAVFNGKIIVRKDAQKTDSKQSNKNLLLSEKAIIDTKPALEIYADDVKCTHGATIGQIDPEAVFYLRSRGIGRQEARELLTYAFANDVLERIKYEPLREQLSEGLFARLARGQRAEEV
jgi:FeS assembly protein SufD